MLLEAGNAEATEGEAMRRIENRASRSRAVLALALSFGGITGAASGSEEFETPPELSASQALVGDLASGTEHRVDDPVRSDGLLDHYTLQSRFGVFEVNGRALLQIRVREMAALAELDRVSKSEVFLGAVARSVTAPLETAADVLQRPVETVTGIPKGIENLFKTYRIKARDATGKAKSVVQQDKKNKENQGEGDSRAEVAGGKVAREAKSYATRYLGVSQADRRWYAMLGVDPYTTNQPLREAVRRVARVDAAASFGMRFSGIPSIPGIGTVRKGMEAIWEEDPLLIRERNRRFLSALGLGKDEVSEFEDNMALSPTHQLAILTLTRALEGVEARGELIRRAIDVDTEEEALTLIESFGLLLRVHEKQPLTQILGGIRLPAARTADGRLVVCAAFDAVYWTERVANGARAFDGVYRDERAAERQVWLSGAISARARAGIERLGWTLIIYTEPAAQASR